MEHAQVAVVLGVPRPKRLSARVQLLPLHTQLPLSSQPLLAPGLSLLVLSSALEFELTLLTRVLCGNGFAISLTYRMCGICEEGFS